MDFGASDAPLSAYRTAPSDLVQIPWALGAVAIDFHISGISRLRLTGEVIAQIYLGQITNWNDQHIAALNKGLHLPDLPITVFWGSNGSGETYAFTHYLSDVSSTFAAKVGSSATARFPVGKGADGDPGMATALRGTNGGIGYIAPSYLSAERLPAAAIQNASGSWELPNVPNIEAAAAVVRHVPANNQVTIVDPPKTARKAYPISTFTYVFAPISAPQGALLQSFISYVLATGGRDFGPALDFAPLPKAVLHADQATLLRIS